MKIEIIKRNDNVLEVGDMLVVQDRGCEPKYRLIYKYHSGYAGLELDNFKNGLTNNTLEGLLSDYKSIYHFVTIVKKDKIKLMGEM